MKRHFIGKNRRHAAAVILTAASMALLVVGCASIDIAGTPYAEWRAGRDMERRGDSNGALSAYRSAGAKGSKMALFDAGRLMLRTEKNGDPDSGRQALQILCDCANTESAGFYYVQTDSEAARAAALAELAHAFENGVAVEQDYSIAGYLYHEAVETRAANSRWFSSHSGNAAYSDVIGRVAQAEKGLSRMTALGYGGEKYRWTEINNRIAPQSSFQKKGGRGTGKDYEIVSMSFSGGNRDETIFEYRIPYGAEFTLATDQAIRREMFAKVKQEYCSRHPGADPSDVRASATHYQKTGNELSYTVAAFWLRPSELEYSATTRKGVLRLRFDGKDLLDAQEWVRGHLEELVNAQNVVITTGQRPAQGAKYKYGSLRSIDDGARLEMHFETVE